MCGAFNHILAAAVELDQLGHFSVTVLHRDPDRAHWLELGAAVRAGYSGGGYCAISLDRKSVV